jgi:trigger factor
VSSTETINDSCKREIQVEVPAEVVARQTEALIQKYQKLARLPGFRRGHVPATIIRQRFGEDLKSEVVEALVPEYFRKETEKQGMKPVSQPRVTDLHVGEGEPLRFKASFEVMPEIGVSGYKEIRAEKPDITVSEEEVEQALKDIRAQYASYTPVEGRALQDGDFAQVSLDGTPQQLARGDKQTSGSGEPVAANTKPVHMDEVMVEIGGAGTMPEFSDNLRGASPGEERSFEVTYPEDFTDQRLAGKTFTYNVRIQAIKQRNVPELNDELAKQAGEFSTVAELKNRIRERLEADKRHTAVHEAKDKLIEELVRRNEFEVPEALVERQIDTRLDRGLRALAAQGMRADDIKKMDFARLRAGQRERALQEVKASLLLEKVSDLEHIEVSDQEVDREVEAIATQAKQTPEAIRARLTRDGALDRIRTRLRNEKTLDFLYHQSA